MDTKELNGHSLNRLAPAEEKGEQPGPMTKAELGRLFYRQIAIGHLPRIGHGGQNMEPVEAVVRSAGAVEMEHGLVQVRGHQLFLLNMFFHLRNQPDGITYSGAQEFNFSPHVPSQSGRKTNWTTNLTSLSEKLDMAAGREIISATGYGRWRRYSVYPGLELSVADDYEARPEVFTSSPRKSTVRFCVTLRRGR